MLMNAPSKGANGELVARDYDACLLRGIDALYLAGYCDGRLSLYLTNMNTGFPQLRARISTQQVGVISLLHEKCELGRLFPTNGSVQLILSARREIAALCQYVQPHLIIKADVVEAGLRFIETQERNERIRAFLTNNASEIAERSWELELREGIKDLYDIGLEIQAYNKGGR